MMGIRANGITMAMREVFTRMGLEDYDRQVA
jgi:hypothetical protein